MTRRDVLKSGAAVAAVPLRSGAPRQNPSSFRLQAEDPTLMALADVVLPAEADRGAAVAAFVTWIEHYAEGADTDHGYGATRVRSTGPSPARTYPTQVAALDAAARAAGSARFAAVSIDQRRAIVHAAVAEAAIDRLPARPTGGHIATDLMGHYFHSSAANDLCYRAEINRDECRGLAGSEAAPKARVAG
jgi:hypothetical protein